MGKTSDVLAFFISLIEDGDWITKVLAIAMIIYYSLFIIQPEAEHEETPG